MVRRINVPATDDQRDAICRPSHGSAHLSDADLRRAPMPHVGGPVVGPGCPTVLIGGKPATRMGNSTAHGGTIAMGCQGPLVVCPNSTGTLPSVWVWCVGTAPHHWPPRSKPLLSQSI
jgi:hypothetical protein